MMVQWRTETCHPNSNKVYKDIYFVVLDGLIYIFQLSHNGMENVRTTIKFWSVPRKTELLGVKVTIDF